MLRHGQTSLDIANIASNAKNASMPGLEDIADS